MPSERPIAVVWGNCQSEPIATFLREPLAAHGYDVRRVPPVYLVNEAQVAEVRELVARCSLLVTQPVRADFRIVGTGSEAMMELAPDDARIVTIPVAYDSTEFPFQVVGHGADGDGVFAPLTSYHDLRLMVAAEQGWDAAKVLEWWPGTLEPTAFLDVSAASLAEMRRRESELDVTVSESMGRAGAMFTVNHPSNSVLTHVANGVMSALGLTPTAEVAAHEELSHTRTALESAVLDAHGWPPELAAGWSVAGEPLSFPEIVDQHLWFYSLRPDVIADARVRHEAQFSMLGL